MAPREESSPPASSIPLIWKYPSHRKAGPVTADSYMDSRRDDDGAEGLWRIHDGLYDLTKFIKRHPGGEHWLLVTKGTDITEAFECHHVTSRAADLLPKFYVRDAQQRRNSPYTFHEDGFWRTFKRRAEPILQRTPETYFSRAFNDSLVAAAFGTAIAAAFFHSYLLATVAALIVSVSAICAHNFTHMRNNWRMYYMSLSWMSLSDWRVTHILSHHQYPNTLMDIEISMHEPMLLYLPTADKPLIHRVSSWVVFTLYAGFVLPMDLPNRLKKFRPEDALPLLYLLAMVLVGGAPLTQAVPMWLYMWAAHSFFFHYLGLTGAHHHPDIFHDGDAPREDRDFGLGQLDATRDRFDYGSNPFLVLSRYGDHALHHLFPTVDHCRLRALYPVFTETLKEFGIEYRFTTAWELFKGSFRQMGRTRPNTRAPGRVIALGHTED
ncbi:hypothetical protein ONE63_005006 [Megalurothrips usitatus]|uniref:Cytochrome b5-related protein n=1 Tax=Megalurothrips usitatus TaxID=439358 RepID=A0AAV7X8B1_9NEOP|nr:hypothetical protein ONE63_005006 [Megalurothrips usitatus]